MILESEYIHIFFKFKLWSIHWSLYKLCIYDLNSNYLKHLNKSNSSLFHHVKSRTNIYQYKLDPPPWMNHSKPLEQCPSQLYILLHTKKSWSGGVLTLSILHMLLIVITIPVINLSRHCLDYKWLRFRIYHTDCLCMWFV